MSIVAKRSPISATAEHLSICVCVLKGGKTKQEIDWHAEWFIRG